MSRLCFRPLVLLSRFSGPSSSSLCSCSHRFVVTAAAVATGQHGAHRGIFLTPYHHRKFATAESFPTTAAATGNHDSSTPDEWKTVYRFNGILFARIIQRLKVYQTVFTCGIFLPWSLASTYFGYEDVASYALGVASFACVMLYVMGTMASRMIGILYINTADPTQLRISRLSYFGNRIDQTLPADMFLPLADTTENLDDAYVVLETVKREPKRSSMRNQILDELFPEKYYLSLKYGTVLDVDSFRAIFGDSAFGRKTKS